ncbi:hypothetical protein [Edaphovirga cremea]|uniref:hypothetical protein n=1 Tax=Edaphovirga cremea TaxID=2267246 RepID=UPI003988CB19
MLYCTSILVSFIAVFLKGFQHKNVNANKLKLIVPTAYLMAAFDWIAITIVVKGDWWVAISAGTGASIGMLVAMLLHDKLFNQKEIKQ